MKWEHDSWNHVKNISSIKYHECHSLFTNNINNFSVMVLRLKLILICWFLGYSIGFTQTNPDSLVNKAFAKIKVPEYDSLIKEYKITRIKQTDNAYLIDITDNEKYIYTIISLKEEKRRKPKIKKGKKYMFLLYSYYDPNIIYIGKDPVYKNLTIKGMTVSFTTDRKTGAIVTTPNLEELYYTSPNEMKNK